MKLPILYETVCASSSPPSLPEEDIITSVREKRERLVGKDFKENRIRQSSLPLVVKHFLLLFNQLENHLDKKYLY